MNFFFCLIHFLSDLGDILHITMSIICEFRKTGLREGGTFLTGVNEITFRVYHENV